MLFASLQNKLLVCGLLLLPASGCNRTSLNRSSIAGAVKLDGKPLERGSILFTPTDGTKGTVAGGEIKNGRYCLDDQRGPSVGQNRVEIRAQRNSGNMVPKPMGAAGEVEPEFVEAIDPRFNSESTLTIEITPGKNTADFNVASK
jgi:hypothetical protein